MRQSLKILLLEDSRMDAEIIERLIVKEIGNCSFRLVMNKASFTAALDEFCPDIILSDNSLPRFNAAEALKIVRQRFPHLPFILVTGTVSEEYAAGIIKQGADDYILKDRMTRLPPAIDTALRYRQAEKEKLRAEQQKEFDRNNMFALINNTADLMWSVDQDFRLITCNDSFNRTVALTSGLPLAKGDNVLSGRFTQEQHDRYKTFYQRGLTGESFTIIDHFDHPVERWSEISFYPIRQGSKVVGTACFSRDITERKKTEEELKKLEAAFFQQKRREQLKITATALEAQEKERTAIGIELHDNVNQILVGTKLILSSAEGDSERSRDLIRSSMKNLQEAIDENRKIAHELVTPDFEGKIFAEEIERLVSNMFTKSGIDCHIETLSFNEELLRDEHKLAAYRIAQEQCTNIIKYAGAHTVTIILQTTPVIFRMVIGDDGTGMEPDKKVDGIGIRNIKGRLSIFSGTVEINTAPGKGFTLEITIPLEK